MVAIAKIGHLLKATKEQRIKILRDMSHRELLKLSFVHRGMGYLLQTESEYTKAKLNRLIAAATVKKAQEDKARQEEEQRRQQQEEEIQRAAEEERRYQEEEEQLRKALEVARAKREAAEQLRRKNEELKKRRVQDEESSKAKRPTEGKEPPNTEYDEWQALLLQIELDEQDAEDSHESVARADPAARAQEEAEQHPSLRLRPRPTLRQERTSNKSAPTEDDQKMSAPKESPGNHPNQATESEEQGDKSEAQETPAGQTEQTSTTVAPEGPVEQSEEKSKEQGEPPPTEKQRTGENRMTDITSEEAKSWAVRATARFLESGGNRVAMVNASPPGGGAESSARSGEINDEQALRERAQRTNGPVAPPQQPAIPTTQKELEQQAMIQELRNQVARLQSNNTSPFSFSPVFAGSQHSNSHSSGGGPPVGPLVQYPKESGIASLQKNIQAGEKYLTRRSIPRFYGHDDKRAVETFKGEVTISSLAELDAVTWVAQFQQAVLDGQLSLAVQQALIPTFIARNSKAEEWLLTGPGFGPPLFATVVAHPSSQAFIQQPATPMAPFRSLSTARMIEVILEIFSRQNGATFFQVMLMQHGVLRPNEGLGPFLTRLESIGRVQFNLMDERSNPDGWSALTNIAVAKSPILQEVWARAREERPDIPPAELFQRLKRRGQVDTQMRYATAAASSMMSLIAGKFAKRPKTPPSVAMAAAAPGAVEFKSSRTPPRGDLGTKTPPRQQPKPSTREATAGTKVLCSTCNGMVALEQGNGTLRVTPHNCRPKGHYREDEDRDGYRRRMDRGRSLDPYDRTRSRTPERRRYYQDRYYDNPRPRNDYYGRRLHDDMQREYRGPWDRDPAIRSRSPWRDREHRDRSGTPDWTNRDRDSRRKGSDGARQPQRDPSREGPSDQTMADKPIPGSQNLPHKVTKQETTSTLVAPVREADDALGWTHN
jgi:hypothetical protein